MCEQSPIILYREIYKGGDDFEGNHPHGVIVTLSFWQSPDWKTKSHYLLEKKAMINREIVIDETDVTVYEYADAKQIRAAITAFDRLCVYLDNHLAERETT